MVSSFLGLVRQTAYQSYRYKCDIGAYMYERRAIVEGQLVTTAITERLEVAVAMRPLPGFLSDR